MSEYNVNLTETKEYGVKVSIFDKRQEKEIGTYYAKFSHSGEKCTVKNITINQIKEDVKSFNKSTHSKFLCIMPNDKLIIK